ncbi:hypothetical protein HY857_00925 [Candidatus Saccharibacteria bacterium]|nr:hypothetical protein [Candidatus Saccharibacteria bacterium]
MSKDKGKKEKKKPKKDKKQQGFTAIEAVLILVILAIIGFVGWYVWHAKNDTNSAYDKAGNLSLASSSAKKSTEQKKASSPTPAPAKVTISDSLKENTAAAIESQNTAALEGYMATSVTVVIAASEKGGAETATQAVKDLDYLNSGTSPWDFKLSDATLASFRNGFYGKYFGADTTIVGQSANKYVVSFGVNTSGKIDTVFMAASADILTQ